MKQCYLIVFKLDGTLYLQMVKNIESDTYHLHAYETVENAFQEFAHFDSKAKSSSYESHISGSYGILQISPHIISVPRDNPQFIEKYILDLKPYKIKGGATGVFLDTVGIKVSESILKLSVCDVVSKIIRNENH